MAASRATTKLVVAGGSGFLGTRICQSAVARGWDVISLSRHGEPSWGKHGSSAQPPRWARSVDWAKANVFDPDTYAPHLKDATAVVYSLGILLEADYKGVLQGKDSVVTGLQKLFGGLREEPSKSKALQSGERVDHPQMSYSTMNRDLAIGLARHASEEKVPTFVYISASAGAPVVPSGYIRSKREAESQIAAEFPDMRSIFVRPTFMYGSDRSFSMPIALGASVGHEANSLLGGRLSPLGIMTAKPLKVGTVGEAVVEAIDDGATKGVVGPPKIESLGTKGWRKTML